MAQVIPAITSLPIDSSAAPSVEDIQDRLPSICVDYLSHDWAEEDVWASWRSMTRHKHEIANGVRLENASWRTWQKQRNKLKTISPETLNWLKDSDVTWLYGPLHTAHVEPVRPLKVATTDERLGIDLPTKKVRPATAATKPILKHRTLSEMLTTPRPSSPILETAYGHDDDVDSSEGDHERPLLLQTKSDTNIIRNRSNPTRRKSPPRGPISGGKNTPADGTSSPPLAVDPVQSGKRHISFNTFVEQCVAIDDPSVIPPTIDESDDEMLEMRSSLSSSSRSSRPSLSRQSSSSSADHLTIAKIAPTLLKTMNAPGGQHQMIYQPPPEYISPGLKSPSHQFDFPSPQVEQHRERWAEHDEDEDVYNAGGFDYFGGPNLGGEEETRGAQPIPANNGSPYRTPTVSQPPPQPKWRQSPAQSAGVEPSSVSSSGSGSSASFNVTSPPQPSRSILKVRPPSAAPPPEPSSPTLAYFNYNPSAATGIGGMRGSTGSYDVAGPTGSPLASPTVPMTEERGRGRSASRDRLNDRSTSRGTSSSSNASYTSASRSPVESAPSNAIRKVQSPPQLDKVQEGITWSPGAQLQQQQQQEAADDNYIPERSSTPTPHSSPQISFRPLKDTSPSSLPHTSTPPLPAPSTSKSTSTPASTIVSTPVTANASSPDLPKADPATTVSPTSPNPNASASASKATIAHVSTNAQPTLSQPQGTEEADGDGASIIGRAANIANTAKDLLGALWYGEGKEQGGRSGQGKGAGGGHRRGASLG